jgi:heterodisulfide reductase subunit A
MRPVDTLTDGVYIAGCSQGPKDIADTVVQAKGAASSVSVLISQKKMSLDPIVSYNEERICRGCGECKLVCKFGAIELVKDDGRLVAKVNEVLCKGCGACVGACCNGAMTIKHFRDEQVMSMVEAAMGRI